MPKKNSTVDELGALKTRHEGVSNGSKIAVQTAEQGGGGILPRFVWVGLAMILALVSAASLTRSYHELRKLADRERALSQKEQRLAEYDQRLSTLSADVAKMDAKAEQLKAEMRMLEGDAAKGAEASAAYKTYSAMLPNLKKETEDLAGRLEFLRGEKSTLDGAVTKAQASLDTIQSAKTAAQTRLDQFEGGIALQKAEVENLQTSIASNKTALVACIQALKEQQAEYASVKRDFESKRLDRDEQVRERDEAKGVLTGLQDAVTRLKSERTTATNELTEMTVELARISARISSERKILADMEAAKTVLNTELTRLGGIKAEYDTLAKKKDDAERALVTLTQQLETQKTLLAGRTAEAAEMTKQVDILASNRLELERSVNQLIGQQNALETKGVKTSSK